jgi:predicted dehydrogenase
MKALQWIKRLFSSEQTQSGPVEIVIVGAGNRGQTYAGYARDFPDQCRVVAVAEPRAEWRERLALEHQLPPERCFDTWEALAAQPRLAHAAIIATQDALHLDPAVALAKLGYHLLVEKPLAPTETDCACIVAAVKESGVILAVGHVLRYTRYTKKLKEVLASGAIGEIVSIQHLEPVGYWHQAHSFVRGNWRSSKESTFMLMAKSCHDLDWLRHIAGRPCLATSSFGSLRHFTKANQPQGAADRCLECDLTTCAYDARKIYYSRYDLGVRGWPLDVLAPEVTREAITEALKTGPYGRCVYACDNDVVDHQVVNLEFADGITAVFTMTAFSKAAPRETRIFGTKGELSGDGRHLRVFDFLTNEEAVIDTEENAPAISSLQGHGGGDFGLMEAFVQAVGSGDPSGILSGPDATLESHRMVFAAEIARLERRVVSLEQ